MPMSVPERGPCAGAAATPARSGSLGAGGVGTSSFDRESLGISATDAAAATGEGGRIVDGSEAGTTAMSPLDGMAWRVLSRSAAGDDALPSACDDPDLAG